MAGNLLSSWKVEDNTPNASPKQQIEDEVHLARFAERAVARFPTASPARRTGDDKGLLAHHIRNLLYLFGAVFTIYLLLPQMGGLRQTWQVLRTVRWGWLVAGLFVLPAGYIAAAVALRGATSRPLGLERTALQLAGSFVNKLTTRRKRRD